MIRWIFALSGLLSAVQLTSQEVYPANCFVRDGVSLDGAWHYIIDPYENGFYNYRYEAFDDQEQPGKAAFFNNAKADGPSDLVEYNFDTSDSITVPGDWNTQKESLMYYEGTVWYKKSFDYDRDLADKRVFLHFGAVNYRADVYVNGIKLGVHEGGFTPFAMEVTGVLRAKDNFVVVKVDNKRSKDAVPTLNTDWWNYGGITRSVKLVEVPATFVSDYHVGLSSADNTRIEGWLQLEGMDAGNKRVEVRIPELGVKQFVFTGDDGRARFSATARALQLWSTATPVLYDVTIFTGEDLLNDKIGFRTVSTSGKDILINGEPVFLKGICLHEESPISGGRATSRADAEQLLSWAKELGCNYVRLAHYPHNEHMVRLADEMGIMVWEEIPVYWTISWDNPDTYRCAEQQLGEVIQRDRNRASVIIWSMANETPTSAVRNDFLTRLAAHARLMDDSRLISAALEQRTVEGTTSVRTIDDPFAEVVDVLSFNQYIGWYDGTPEKCKQITWQIDQDKPVLISEFGAGAKAGLRGDISARWTEDYQDHLYQQTLTMIDKIDQLSGLSPWILVDFRSPRRVLPTIQDGWNRKGLMAPDGTHKMAFKTLQAYYQMR